MKKYIYIITILLVIVSCNDDYLDRYPLDFVSEEMVFKTEADFELYVNQFYDLFSNNPSLYKFFGQENGVDNLIGIRDIQFPTAKLYQTSSDAPVSSSNWNSSYDWIRRINYFIEQKDKIPAEELTAKGTHMVGEGYFYRAWLYFNLLSTYGGVPYIDKVLSTNSEELYTPRMSRDQLMSKIVEDLDVAISKLQWSGEGGIPKGRVSKDMALGYKARFCLFEGSWEYYHQGTSFGVSGKNGQEFLEHAVEAAQALIDQLGANVYTGSAGREYFDLFSQVDYSNIPEVLHFKTNSVEEGFHYDLIWEAPYGLTKSMVDAYLMDDGLPKELSSNYMGDDNINDLVKNRDPRLQQTTYYSDKYGPVSNISPYYEGIDNTLPMPSPSLRSDYCASGYYCIKSWDFDATDLMPYESDDGIIYLRYAEVLLAYAEAKAILDEIGTATLTQADIDKTINVLRDRVGMAHMNLGVVKSWEGNSDYMKYHPSQSSVINEIRRERRIELVAEGYRHDDLRRWRALEEILLGYIPRGAKANQFYEYYDELLAGELHEGSDGYIYPGGNDGRFTEGGSGGLVSDERDYLSPIPFGQINLYEDKGNVTLEQNPGWF